mmetsp:Transcript_6978/g.17097  ORF Transcript_6978/g.17097 Transcript_6978/m.17097 type:complete len:496 (+) Transcript_6978:437-1924(+)
MGKPQKGAAATFSFPLSTLESSPVDFLQAFYGADNVDYELMDSEEEKEALRDEEEEAIEIQKRQRENMLAADFLALEDNGESEDDDTAQASEEKPNKASQTWGQMAGIEDYYDEDKLVLSLEAEFRAAVEGSELLKKELAMARSQGLRQGFISHAELRYSVSLSYVQNLSFYLTFKVGGGDPSAHPVVEELVKLKMAMQNLQKIGPSLSSEAAAKYAETENKKAAAAAKTETRPLYDENSGEDSESAGLNDADDADGLAQNHGDDESGSENGGLSDAPDEKDMDDDFVQAILRRGAPPDKPNHNAGGKQGKLNEFLTHLDNERKSDAVKRKVSADATGDLLPGQSAERNENVQNGEVFNPGAPDSDDGIASDDELDEDEEEPTAPSSKVQRKALRREARKKETAKKVPHKYTFKDNIAEGEQRRASVDILKNRGLTPYRKKDKKNPRVKHRTKFASAVKRRRGAIREYKGQNMSGYGGETTGINKRATKSVRLRS